MFAICASSTENWSIQFYDERQAICLPRVSHIVRTNKLMYAADSINARTRTIK